MIDAAWQRLMGEVREYQLARPKESNDLLGELTRARLCLKDRAQRDAYDEKLCRENRALRRLRRLSRRAVEPPPQRPATPTPPPKPTAKSDAGEFVGAAVGSAPPREQAVADRAGRHASKPKINTLLLTAGISALGLAIIIGVIFGVYVGRTDPTTVNNHQDTGGEDPGSGMKNVETQSPINIKTGQSVAPPRTTEIVDPPIAVASTVKWPWQPRKQTERPSLEAPPLKLSAAVLKPLHAARAAMQERALDETDQQIEAAATASKTPLEKSEVERHREIFMMLQAYWNAVSRGLEKTKEGEKLIYRMGRVTVISKDGSQLTLEAENGAQKSFKTDAKTINLELAHALAQDQLDAMGPVGLAVLGAAKAMDRQVDIARAKDLWKQASDRGILISQFVPEVNYDFAKLVADTTPVPQDRKRP